tara:strand:- start:19 stop:363 length:345 start_codon:yes stop_codon:yes gene_type:complete
MTKFKSINIAPNDPDFDVAKYYCSWNGGEIIQIHTKETLYEEYKDTNLFDGNGKLVSYPFGNSHAPSKHFKPLTMNEYLYNSSINEIKIGGGFDVNEYLNENFICDNMEIKRIV